MNLYWIYDIPTVAAVGVFAALFVGICWTGTILFRPIVRAIVHHQPGLNETIGDFLQYLNPHRSPHSIATSAVIPSLRVRSCGGFCTTIRGM